jgi:hypothetical protein
MKINHENHHLQDYTIHIPEHSWQLQQPAQHFVQQRISEDTPQGTWHTSKIHMAVKSGSILLLHTAHRILPVTEEKYIYVGHITHTEHKTHNTPPRYKFTNHKIGAGYLRSRGL